MSEVRAAEWLEFVRQEYPLTEVALVGDLGGNYNLNLQVSTDRGALVVRVSPEWVNADRLAAVQAVRGYLRGLRWPTPETRDTPWAYGLSPQGRSGNGASIDLPQWVESLPAATIPRGFSLTASVRRGWLAAGDYSPVMGEPDSAEDYWLEGGVDALTMGAESGFLQEVDRVIDLLGTDESWLAWWRRISKAPTLEVHIVAVRAEYEGIVEERVVRGRKRHLVEMRIDFEELEALERDERRLLALPAVLEGVSRAEQALKLTGEHPGIPDSVRPAPLSAGTLRRRRLRELSGVTNAPLPQNPFPNRGERQTATPTVRSVLRPQARLTPIPAVASQDPSGGQLVVEIHLPLNGAGNILPGGPGYEFGWIDDTEEFLDDESSDGSFDIYDEGEDFGETYVFFVAGAPEDVLLRVAADVAALPGIPSGAFAVVTDDKSEEIGNGRRVALS